MLTEVGPDAFGGRMVARVWVDGTVEGRLDVGAANAEQPPMRRLLLSR